MEQLKVCVEELVHDRCAHSENTIYNLLYDVDVDSDTQLFTSIIPDLYKLCQNGKLQKDMIYLTLIASRESKIALKKFIEHGRFSVTLDNLTSETIFEYCIFKKHHWFAEILNASNNLGKEHFSTEIYEKLLILKLFDVTNAALIDTVAIKSILNEIEDNNTDTLTNFFVKEVRNAVDLVDFITTVSPLANINTKDVIYYTINNSNIKTISMYMNLKLIQSWKYIIKKIEHSDKDIETFKAFAVIFSILACLNIFDTPSNIEDILENANNQLLSIKNKELQLEVINILFTFLFLRKEHLQGYGTREGFTNEAKETSIILKFLKSVFETIKVKNLLEKNTVEFKLFTEVDKHLVDAQWRYELVTSIKTFDSSLSRNHRFLSYMLASPESLINVCLKKGNFERAMQVVQIFNLHGTFLARETKYSMQLQEFRKTLRALYIKNQMERDKNNTPSQESLQNSVKDYFISNKAPVCEEIDSLLEQKVNDFPYLSQLQARNNAFMDIFDIAITQPKNFDDCKALIDVAFEESGFKESNYSTYLQFCLTINSILNELGGKYKCSAVNILNSSRIKLDFQASKNEEELYQCLKELFELFNEQIAAQAEGSVDPQHVSHKSYIKLNDICERLAFCCAENKSVTSYLQRLYSYLRAFSRVLYVEGDNSEVLSLGKNVSYFEILNFNRAELMGKLLFERKLNPTNYEQHFSNMKLSLLYHIVGNCFPTINLHQEDISTDEMYPENRLFVPDENIIDYIQKRNWLLAYILNEMYNVCASTIDVNEIRIQNFVNYMQLPRIQQLKILFNDSELIASLQNEINTEKTMAFITNMIKKDAIRIRHSSTSSGSSTESGEEMFEEHLKTTDWKLLYDIIESIPENQLRKTNEYSVLQDLILENIVAEQWITGFYEYVRKISNRTLRIETTLHNFKYWPLNFCIDIISAELSNLTASDFEAKTELEIWLKRLQLYENISDIIQQSSWYDIHKLCIKDKEQVLKKILFTTKIEVLLQFIEVFKLSESILLNVSAAYLFSVFEAEAPLSNITELLQMLPKDHAVGVCYNLLKMLKKLDHLQFTIDYLLEITNEETELLKNIRISLKILSVFPQQYQDQLWCLITEPLSIIEILVMNTKLDKLSQVLELIEVDLKNSENDETVLRRENIDVLLRNYAEKSLDFRVALQTGQRMQTPESKLLESLDSISFISDRKKFVMPTEVPDRSEWVKEATECMCCQQSTFSMFNRRHHCRRCGRVVCYNCSLKRMRVPTYGDILVRVCLDCFEQSNSPSTSSKSDSGSGKFTVPYDFWLFTDEPLHNRIVREEFSYEHAPNVSLCLAILKNHSKTMEYPTFLLDQCNNMLKLLHTIQEGIHEIDYLLLIKMLKSLAIAAKMLCSECMLHWGTSLAHKILSQADLLNLLIERGCLNLLPSNTIHGNFIDASALRRLRDKLMEDEQWHLALEISTKAGLDNIGIFAAWGKSCLKAGNLPLARDKFQRCFDKTSHFDTSGELDESLGSGRWKLQSRLSTLSMGSDKGPAKDPPLLEEIIKILEFNTTPINSEVVIKFEEQSRSLSTSMSSLNFNSSPPSEMAFCILSKLKNLENIIEEKSTILDKGNNYTDIPHMEALFFDECVYYLQRYGTRISMLRFYMKHRQFESALTYIIDLHLGPEVFTEIYMTCLKEGVIDVLHEHLMVIDPTLNDWQEYLKHTCRYLEKQNLLNCLYQLQIFTGDSIRAAMTCIRFYKDNVRTFTELNERVNFLLQAEEHLKQNLEQQQWVEVAAVPRGSVSSADSFEEKAITNPSLVMKMDPRLIEHHINTIWRQTEVARFLAECEKTGRINLNILPEIVPLFEEDSGKNNDTTIHIPTLFEGFIEKMQLAVLAIVSGESIIDGFNIGNMIVEEFKLKPTKVYCLAGNHLAKSQRYSDISQLITCIHSTLEDQAAVSYMCDEMLQLSIRTLIKMNFVGPELEGLIKQISDKSAKISAYIEAKQLKSAYFLAVKYKRLTDVRRIMREAELLNQPNIKSLCQKILQSHSSQSQSSHT